MLSFSFSLDTNANTVPTLIGDIHTIINLAYDSIDLYLQQETHTAEKDYV